MFGDECYFFVAVVLLFQQAGYSICANLVFMKLAFVGLKMLVYDIGNFCGSDQTVSSQYLANEGNIESSF